MLTQRICDVGKVNRSRDCRLVASRTACKVLRYRFPAVLLIGSEKRGFSEQLLETADFVVRIPMQGACDSINAALAAGVLLFELCSQLRGS